jgi:uroporphyrinogen decarboxylase
MMTSTERLENLLKGVSVDRPPFIPAIYDLKPAFLQTAPHTFGQKQQDIIDALIFEAEQLEADALTAAYDIYNIEAEAVGCSVLRNPEIFMPEIERPLISSLTELDKLEIPGGISGRMEVFIQASEYLLQKYEGSVPVRGGISGPFTMATKIFPKESILMETVMNPEKLIPLLRFCSETIKIYAKAFADIGAGVIVFDSFVSPPMLSPQTYHDLILPFHRDIFHFLKRLGVLQRTLIIGGNTLPIIHDIISSGATQFLLDFTMPLETIKNVLQEYPDSIFRVNLPPSAFISRDTSELKDIILKTLESLKYHKNLIIGTGILPPNVPPANILSAKNQIANFYN